MENLEDNHRVRCDARTYNPFVLPREIIPILRILICPFPIPGQDVAEPILSKSTSLAGFSRLCGYILIHSNTFYRLSVHWHDSPTAKQYSRKLKSRTMTMSLLEAHPRSDDTISVGDSRKLRFKQCHKVPWSWRKVTLHILPVQSVHTRPLPALLLGVCVVIEFSIICLVI